jgi:2-oxoisovalerate dehydrogenase E1 component
MNPAQNPREFLELYRLMLLSRRLDDAEIKLKRQNKSFFQISGAGHEAVQVAAAKALIPGLDWIFPYYRDRALCLAIGLTPEQMLLGAVGSDEEIGSGGRQPPSHWSHGKLNIVGFSGSTGAQFLQAVGCAEASARYSGIVRKGGDQSTVGAEIVLCAAGEGATSEGAFWEALNTASILKLPILFLIEDNGYAVSVPVEVQTAGGSISRLVGGFPGLHLEEVDGCDIPACLSTLARAAEHCRTRRGPALVHAHVIRPYSHSLSDDERHYRSALERERDALRDPLTTFPRWLLDRGLATPAQLEALESQVDSTVEAAQEAALSSRAPRPETAIVHTFSETVDPTGSHFDTAGKAQFSGLETTMVDLINRCLRDEMDRDGRVVVFGQDVADVSRTDLLGELPGKGGIFKVTAGLQREFGGHRVFNTPLAEASIIGRAIGLALRGVKPVVEAQFFADLWNAYGQIRMELAQLRWRTRAAFMAPIVIRVTYGNAAGAGAYISQTGVGVYANIPGIHIVCPATALDANGLLRTAIRCEDPVLFLEHRQLYRQAYNLGVYPGPDFMIPFGRAKLVRKGTDVTVVTYGALVHQSLLAAAEIEAAYGISAEIVDLRSLYPVDWDTLRESVRRTRRVVVLQEDSLSWGYGSELAARLARECFDSLVSPVRVVGAADSFVPYAPRLAESILPTASGIARVLRELAGGLRPHPGLGTRRKPSAGGSGIDQGSWESATAPEETAASEAAPRLSVLTLDGSLAQLHSQMESVGLTGRERLRVHWSSNEPVPGSRPLGSGSLQVVVGSGVVFTEPRPVALDRVGRNRFRWVQTVGEAAPEEVPWVLVALDFPATLSLRNPSPLPVAAKSLNGRVASYWCLRVDSLGRAVLEWDLQLNEAGGETSAGLLQQISTGEDPPLTSRIDIDRLPFGHDRSVTVFLCHSKHDKPKVRQIRERLLRDGFTPWLDEEDLLAGEHWQPAIERALRSSHVVLVCLSRESVSGAGFRQKEISFALEVAEEQPEGTNFIIPLKLEDVELPARLSKWHALNYFQEGAHERLVKALQHRASRLRP